MDLYIRHLAFLLPIMRKTGKFLIFSLIVGFFASAAVNSYGSAALALSIQQPKDDSKVLNSVNKCVINSGYENHIGTNSLNYHANNMASKTGIYIGGSPYRLAIDPKTELIYIADKFSKKISFVDGVTDKVVRNVSLAGMKSISVGFNKSNLYELRSGIAIDPTTRLLYFTSTDSSSLQVLDGNSGAKITNITLSGSPYALIANNTEIDVVTSTEQPPDYKSSVNVVYQYFNKVHSQSPLVGVLEGLDRDDVTKTVYVVGGATLYEFNDPSFTKNFNISNSAAQLRGVVINPSTEMAYMTANTGTVFALNLISGHIDEIHTSGSTRSIAINRNTNMIYASALDPNTVAVINGTTNCLLTEIPVGDEPEGLVVDPTRNMIYVANMKSGTISAVNGKTNNLTSVIRVNVNPSNSGYVECNNKKLQQNFNRYDIGTKIICQGKAYKGFEFSSWSGDLVPYTITDGVNTNSNSTIEIEISKYGTLSANFILSNPVSIPPEFWTPIYGIIPAIIVSTFIPSLLQHNKGKKESKRYRNYYSDQIGKSDDEKLEKEIIKLYNEGKINESDYQSLKEKIKAYKDKSEGFTSGSPFSRAK